MRLLVSSARHGLRLFDLDAQGWHDRAASEDWHATWCVRRGGQVVVGGGVFGYWNGSCGILRSYALDDLAQPLSEVPCPGGRPAYVAIAPGGAHVITAAYFGGCTSLFPLADDGALGPPLAVHHHLGRGVQVPRQQAAHAHGVACSPVGDTVLVPDLGTDSTWVYRYRDGELIVADPAQVAAWPETGPRHACWRDDGRVAWVVGELNGLVQILAHDPATGAVTTRGSASALPPGYAGPVGAADLRLHPSGRWLYTNLRAPELIVRFRVADDGSLHDPVHHSDMPNARCLWPTPDGSELVVAHTGADRLSVYPIADDGRLGPSRADVQLAQPMGIVSAEPS